MKIAAVAAVLLLVLAASLDAQTTRPPRFDEEAARREAKAKGIPESDLPGWLRFKRAEFEARRPGTGTPVPPLNACLNGNAELGNFTNWQALAGSNTVTNGLALGTTAPLPGRHTIESGSGADPIVASIPRVLGGAFAFRLGNALSGNQAEGLTFSFTVTPVNQNFTFSYAMVMEDPGHPPQEQPFFLYEVKTAGGTVVKTVRRTANTNDPYFKSTTGPSGTVVYKDWDCDSVDLSAFLGQAMTITFITADCSQGGHFGYAYVDDLCVSNLVPSFTLLDAICADAPLIADATATSNEKDHFWSIEESDANWGRNPATEVSQWYLAQQAGVFNLKAFYASKGKAFQCNKYYRIKLAVRNGCEAWKELVKLVYIRCPPVANAGPDRAVCCESSTSSVTLGGRGGPLPGLTYAWTSPSGFTSTSANPTVPVTCNNLYTVTVTDAHGCKSSDTVLVRIDKPFDLVLKSSEASVDICDRSAVLSPELIDVSNCILGVNCPTSGRGPQATFVWSTGSTAPSIGVNPTTPTTYSVTATNSCTTKTAQTTVTPCPALTGAFPSLIFPNAFTPNGDGTNDTLIIYHLGIAAGDRPAYNAVNWKLIVWDRWGQEIAHRDGGNDTSRCIGIPNGAVRWDGRSDAGNVLPQGVYTWRLYLKNCSQQNYPEVKTASVTLIR